MKKIISIIVCFCLIFIGGTNQKSYAAINDMQAAWITTVHNIDWPSKKNDINVQKQEMIKILDTLKDTGINTVMFQVRPKSDALYKSNINPWSDVLTGTQGKDPGYDPLGFVVSEAHKRGIKVHAWLNPYRVTTSGTDLTKLSENNTARKNPSWLIEYDVNTADKKALAYNPALPQVKNHIANTVQEIVKNYDVDGIHFDDYFYPSTYKLPEGESRDGKVANERRNHVNEMILQVRKAIKDIKPSVEFGISPSGVWKNKSSDPIGSDTKGAKESYYSDYADTVKWIKEGYIDYVVPQVYWEIDHKIAPYKVVTKWWADIVKGTNVDLYIGHYADKELVAKEIDKQLEFNNQYSTIKGSVYYTTRALMENKGGSRDKIKTFISNNKVFSDIRGHWAKSQILDFINKGYIGGYPDGTFKPDNSITRAEFVVIFNNYFNLTRSSGKEFNDTKEHWAKQAIDVAITNGVCNGKSETEFKPNDYITREEAAVMIANYKKLYDTNLDKLDKYNDGNKVSSWAKSSVESVIEKGYMGGYEDNTFKPKNKITRAEALVTLSRIQQ